MYYALVALHSPRPRIRVSGLAILATVTESSEAYSLNVLAHLQSFSELVHDSWWEVQAQLLVVTAHMLKHTAAAQRAAAGEGEDGGLIVTDDAAVESLLLIVIQ